MARNRVPQTGCGAFVHWCTNNPCIIYTVLAVRWFPVVFICGVIAWGYYAYVVQLCFYSVNNWIERIAYLIPGHMLAGLFMWAYFQCIFSEIGQPPKAFYPPDDVLNELDECRSPSQRHAVLERYLRQHNLSVTMRGFDGAIRFCEKCQCIKPDRCHHCSICGHCILKFDHHCPWVNTCVNFRNYKFFVQFLGYALVLCAFAALTDLQYFVHFWQTGLRSSDSGKFHILFLFFASGMFAISVSTLFFYHLWLTSRNQSTIESFRAPMFTYGADKHGFNLGVRRNFLEIFGHNRLLWFLPMFSSHGNGVIYPLPGSDPESSGAQQLLQTRYTLIQQTYSSDDEDDLSVINDNEAAAHQLLPASPPPSTNLNNSSNNNFNINNGFVMSNNNNSFHQQQQQQQPPAHHISDQLVAAAL